MMMAWTGCGPRTARAIWRQGCSGRGNLRVVHVVVGTILAHRDLALHRRHRLSCLHPCSRLLCCSWYLVSIRASTMAPVLSALFAFVVTGFQSRPDLPLKILALQHQGAVYKQNPQSSRQNSRPSRQSERSFMGRGTDIEQVQNEKNPLPSAACHTRQHHANEGRGRNGVGTRRTLGSLRIDRLSYQRCRPH